MAKAAKAKEKKKKRGKMSQEELEQQMMEQGFPIQRAMLNPSELVMPPKYLAEERLKMFLAIVLFLLFLLFFGGIAWYFISASTVADDAATASVSVTEAVFEEDSTYEV